MANMGSTRKSRVALTKMVVEKSTIVEAQPESPLLAEPFPTTFPPADMKLCAFRLLALLVTVPARNCSEEPDGGQYAKAWVGYTSE